MTTLSGLQTARTLSQCLLRSCCQSWSDNCDRTNEPMRLIDGHERFSCYVQIYCCWSVGRSVGAPCKHLQRAARAATLQEVLAFRHRRIIKQSILFDQISIYVYVLMNSSQKTDMKSFPVNLRVIWTRGKVISGRSVLRRLLIVMVELCL
jgi:hypothetical protein